jgi:RimJ/RimL family protein N-acetyltransferase
VRGLWSPDDAGHVGPRDRRRLRTRIARSGRFTNGRLDLGIEVDGRLVGQIEARRAPGFVPPGVFELGLGLFGPERGRGYGSEAIALLTEHLFEAEDAARVQAGTLVDNAAMRRVFEKLGFTEEGVMRDFLPSGDGRGDCVLYAITRRDRDSA